MKGTVWVITLITLVNFSKAGWLDFWNWGKIKEGASDLVSGDRCIAYYSDGNRYAGRCKTCEAGFYTNPDAGVFDCQRCLENCATCSNSNSCINCKIGFHRKTETECASCVTGCSKCENAETCEICQQGYFQTINLLCQKCPINCQKCLEKGKCKECDRSYFLDSDGGCSSCGGNCDECHNRFHCEKCHTGYEAGVDGECVVKRLTSLLYVGFALIGGLATCALCFYFCSRTREPTMRGYNGPNGYELWNGEGEATKPVGGWSGSTVYDRPGAQQYHPFFEKQYNDGYGMKNPVTGGYDRGGSFESDRGYF